MNKKELEKYLKEGKTTREIAKLLDFSNSNVSYWIKKHGIEHLYKYSKTIYVDENMFKKIDTKEKAYIVGFLIGDGHIDKRGYVSCSISLSDKEVLKFISKNIGCHVREYYKTDKSKKIFPSASIVIGNKRMIIDFKKLFGGRLKVERRLPIIPKNLERYLLLGFFDAEGCITWGRRKDRDRVWQKISFTSHYKMLLGIQNILLKYNIASRIYPKKDSNCFVMDISSKEKVLEILDIIYPKNEILSNDKFIVLNRKFEKANALRLELDEFGEA